jgi:hypothetical protein
MVEKSHVLHYDNLRREKSRERKKGTALFVFTNHPPLHAPKAMLKRREKLFFIVQTI